MNHFADLKTFDGLDNRKEVMILLQRLGSDQRRNNFLQSLMPHSLKGFVANAKVTGPCDPVAAYFCLIGICNELGVSINYAARRLEEWIRKSDQPMMRHG